MHIEIKNLKKTFQDATRSLTIIDCLSVELNSGQATAIVGRSGIGKSTLLQILAGLEESTSGVITYDRQASTQWTNDQFSSFRQKYVGFVFQFPNLLPEFTARENIALPLALAGAYEGLVRADQLLTWVQLKDRSSHRPAQMSGGEQQRLSIARALVNQPKLILADEPTGSLDPQTGNEVGSLLLDTAKAAKASLIAVTHNPEFAKKFDCIYEMQPGGYLEKTK